MSKFSCFEYTGAILINISRIEYIKKYYNISNKKTLETGCGAKGDITRFLIEQNPL